MSFQDTVNPEPTPSIYTLEPINIYATELYFPNKFSIIFIESGIGTWQIDHTQFNFSGPSVICLNPTEHLILGHSSHVKGHILTFTPSSLKSYFTFDNIKTFEHYFSPNDINLALHLSIFYQRSSSYTGYIQISEIMLKQFYKLLNQLSLKHCDNDLISTVLINILAPIKRLVQTSMSVANIIISETTFEIKDVLIYLHNHCNQKITIPKLSKQFHVNRTTLSDRFYEATGETIITYLNKYRINLAAIMLRESNHSISTIAEEVGFNDTAYFAKLFKKYMFHTPSGYRQHYLSLCQMPKAEDA